MPSKDEYLEQVSRTVSEAKRLAFEANDWALKKQHVIVIRIILYEINLFLCYRMEFPFIPQSWRIAK